MANRINETLSRAADLVTQRRKTYGDPVSFFEDVAKRWTLTLGVPVEPSQVVLCMLDLKLERLSRNPAHIDSIIDTAGYAAILQEIVQ